MKNLFNVACVFILLLINGCDRCDGIACSTGPPTFSIEIVDAKTGINVFTSEKYDPKSIMITDQNNKTIYLRFVSENKINTISISPNSEKGKHKLTLKAGTDLVIPIEVNVREGGEKCCTNYFLDGITVTGYDYEIAKETGLIIIKI